MIISEKSYLNFSSIELLDKLKDSTKYEPLYVLIERIQKEKEDLAKELAKRAKEKIKESEKYSTETAKGLKRRGVKTSIIVEVTGLSIEEIKELKVHSKNKLNLF